MGGPGLAGALAAVSPADLDDWDLIEAMRGWERLASWVAAGQLAVIAEFARRRPRDYVEAGPGGHADRGDPRVPQVSEYAVDEVAAALRLSRPAAGARLQLAVELAGRLPGTAAALAAGVHRRAEDPRGRRGGDRAGRPARRRGRSAGAARAPAGGPSGSCAPRWPGRAVGRPGRRRGPAHRGRRRPAGHHPPARRRDGRAVGAAARRRRHRRLHPHRPARPPPPPPTTRWTPQHAPRMDARRADALVAAVLAAAAAGPAPPPRDAPRAACGRCGCAPTCTSPSPPPPPSASSDQPGELTGHGPIPASMARRLAAAGTWRRVSRRPGHRRRHRRRPRPATPPQPRSPTWSAPATAPAASPAAATPPAAATSTTSSPGRPAPPPPTTWPPCAATTTASNTKPVDGRSRPTAPGSLDQPHRPPLHHHPSRALSRSGQPSPTMTVWASRTGSSGLGWSWWWCRRWVGSRRCRGRSRRSRSG